MTRRLSYHGYYRVNVPGRGRMLEHRHVMEQHLGRMLSSDELIHHINGVKTDNRLENLEIVLRPVHAKIHQRTWKVCPHCGSKQWVKGDS